MKHLFFLLCFCPMISVHAQAWKWKRSLQTPPLEGLQMKTDASGNIWLAGKLLDTGEFEGIFLYKGTFLSKFTADGEILWAKNFTGMSSFAFTPADEAILAGNFENRLTLPERNVQSRGKADFYLARLSKNGRVLHLQTFGGATYESVSAVACDASGNIYITGRFSDSLRMGRHSVREQSRFSNFYVSCLNPSFETQWLSKGSWEHRAGLQLAIDGRGLITVLGTFADTCFMCLPGYFISRYTRSGANVSMKNYAGERYESEYRLEVSGASVYQLGRECNRNFCSYSMCRYEPDMRRSWTLPLGNGFKFALTCGAPLPDGSMLLGGFYGYDKEDSVRVNGRALPKKGKLADLMLARVNEYGGISWIKTAAGDRWESVDLVAADRAGNMVVFGHAYRAQGGGAILFDGDTLKNASFFLASLIDDESSRRPGALAEQLIKVQSDDGMLKLSFYEAWKCTSLCLTDITGNTCMLQEVYGSDHCQMDVSAQPRGLYFLKVTSESMNLVRKVIIK